MGGKDASPHGAVPPHYVKSRLATLAGTTWSIVQAPLTWKLAPVVVVGVIIVEGVVIWRKHRKQEEQQELTRREQWKKKK